MNETTSFIPETYIGEKWNWYINGYDTGIRARGVSGSSRKFHLNAWEGIEACFPLFQKKAGFLCTPYR